MPQLPYYDGDFTVAKPTGVLRTENPFPWQSHCRILRQSFVQLATHFAELPANTPFESVISSNDSLAGTFTLTWRGNSTGALSVNSSAATVQAAIQAITGFSAVGYCVVTGSFTAGLAVELHRTGTAKFGWDLILGNVAGVTPTYSVSTTMASTSTYVNVQRILPVPLSTITVGNAYLIEETPRQDIEGGLVQWDRVYANIPATWYEFPAYNYQAQRAQFYRIPWSGASGVMSAYYGPVIYRTFVALAEWTEPLIANVRHSYYLIPDGTQNIEKKIKASIPYRVIHIQDSFGREQVYVIGTFGVAEPTSAERWKGNIFHVKDTFVNPFIPAGP